MLDFNPISAYANNPSSTNPSNPKKELDRDAFLMLLVTELRNQNPLEPMENKDFVNQMAQFTTLEQITNMSVALQDFLGTMNSTMRLQASGVVGKYVVIEDHQIALRDQMPANILYNVEEKAEVRIRIKDNQGRMVYEKEMGVIDPGLYSFVWDGRNNAGVMQSDGVYTYDLLRIEGGQEISFGGVVGGQVEAVQFEGNEIYVIVNGEKYAFNRIVEITVVTEEA
jgi:flagellar basal-body rod modification protein FlgD